jgi:hypothetical protein
MNWSNIATQVNWKTTGYGIGYIVCKLIGSLFPGISTACEVLETLIVGSGLVSAADSTRVKSIVQAVDHLLWKAQVDPETLAPIVVKP